MRPDVAACSGMHHVRVDSVEYELYFNVLFTRNKMLDNFTRGQLMTLMTRGVG